MIVLLENLVGVLFGSVTYCHHETLSLSPALLTVVCYSVLLLLLFYKVLFQKSSLRSPDFLYRNSQKSGRYFILIVIIVVVIITKKSQLPIQSSMKVP